MKSRCWPVKMVPFFYDSLAVRYCWIPPDFPIWWLIFAARQDAKIRAIWECSGGLKQQQQHVSCSLMGSFSCFLISHLSQLLLWLLPSLLPLSLPGSCQEKKSRRRSTCLGWGSVSLLLPPILMTKRAKWWKGLHMRSPSRVASPPKAWLAWGKMWRLEVQTGRMWGCGLLGVFCHWTKHAQEFLVTLSISYVWISPCKSHYLVKIKIFCSGFLDKMRPYIKFGSRLMVLLSWKALTGRCGFFLML